MSLPKHLSTLTLHQFRYGELSSEQHREAQAHLEMCEHCAKRLRAQEQERQAFELRPVPEAIRNAKPAAAGWWRAFRRWWGPVGLAMAAAVALIIVSLPPESREKGTPPDALEVWVDAGEGPRPLRPNEALTEGDRVQLTYRADGSTQVAFAGRDHTGVVELYGGRPVPPGPGMRNAPFALALDDAPGPQEFFVILSDRPLDDATVIRAVQAPLEPPDIRVLRVEIEKEPPPERPGR